MFPVAELAPVPVTLVGVATGGMLTLVGVTEVLIRGPMELLLDPPLA